MERSGLGKGAAAGAGATASSPKASPVRPRVSSSNDAPRRTPVALAARLASAASAAPAPFSAPPLAPPPPKRRRLLLVAAPAPPPPPSRARARAPATAAATADLDLAIDNDNDIDEENDDDDPDAEGGRGSGRFRFWYDEQRFKGRPDSCVVPGALERQQLGGVRTGGHPKRSPVPGPLGWTRPGEWDLLWSPARTALKCAESRRLRPGQLCSALPGMAAITRKRRLADSLLRAYGEGKGGGEETDDDDDCVCPLTFELPARLDAWRAHLDAEGERRPRKSSRWMLKTADHMGMGLALMDGEAAYAAASAQARQLMRRAAAAAARRRAKQQQEGAAAAVAPLPASAAAAAATTHHKPFLLAQRYVEDPLLLRPELRGERQLDVGGGGGGNGNGDGNGGGGRKFGLRLWMVVTGVDPLRAHVFKRGLVLFSDVPYSSQQQEEEERQAERQHQQQQQRPPDGGLRPTQPPQPPPPPPSPPPLPARAHVTNYAANTDGDVWDLADLERALGPEPFALVWRRCLRACALAAAAALPSARAEKARLRYPRESCFELVGLDFLVDQRLKPWMLEANSTPSLTAEHADPQTRALIAQTKRALVEGAMRLLGAPGRFDGRYAPLRAWVASKRRAARGGGSAARSAALEREAARLEPAAAAASKALVSSGGGGGGGGEERAEEEEDDDDNEGAAAVAAAVAELGRAEDAGFDPLFAHMPYDEVFERGWDVPFSAEDFALRDVWRRMSATGVGEAEAAPTEAAPTETTPTVAAAP